MLKLLPVLFLLIGAGAGVGVGLAFAPAPGPAQEATDAAAPAAGDDGPGGSEFVDLTDHFVVPVVSDTRVEALVVASLSVEVATGTSDMVYDREPRLRDAFLQTLMDHASVGGFDGRFTATARMDDLRAALRDAARGVIGRTVHDVLIIEIARQDS